MLPKQGSTWRGRAVGLVSSVLSIGHAPALAGALYVATAVALPASSARADLGEQIAKLLPDDGGAGHEFGIAVAISGSTAIVGATYSGSAYLFDITTGEQIAKLADDGETSDYFGYSVAISGSTAIVGALGDDDNGQDSGSAYLFDITTGDQLAKLDARRR